MAHKKGIKDIDGNLSIWPAYYRPWYKRFIRRLYKKYVGEIYLPTGITATLRNELQTGHPKYGKVTHIIFTGPGCDVNGAYLFDDLGNKIESPQLP